MRIAQIAPLYETVPPRHYGGTERVIAALTDELTLRGHDVTLFAAAGSTADAELDARASGPLRTLLSSQDLVSLAPHLHLAMLADVFRRADEFDVIHSHVDIWGFPFASMVSTPTLTTMHGRLDLDIVWQMVRLHPTVPLVSISRAQRTPLRQARVRWEGNVYNGLKFDQYATASGRGEYLAFVGRLTPEKRPDRAVRIAAECGIPLRVAAKVDPLDVDYYRDVIEPIFRRERVEFIGEIGEDEKPEFFGGALATLMPIDWPEPFGLVMTESLAAGTPVVAMNHGSVPEIIEHGVSGMICDSVDEMIDAVNHIDLIDRNACRRRAARFDHRRMTDGYIDVYAHMLASRRAA